MANIRSRSASNTNATSTRILRSQTTRVLRSHTSLTNRDGAKVTKRAAAAVNGTPKRTNGNSARVTKRAAKRAGDVAAKAPLVALSADLLLSVTDCLPATDVAMLGFTCRGLHDFVRSRWQARHGPSIPHLEATTTETWGRVVHQKERMEATIFAPCASQKEVRAQALSRAQRLENDEFRMVALQSAPPEEYHGDWAAEFIIEYLARSERYAEAIAYWQDIPRPLTRAALEVVTKVLVESPDAALLEEVVPALRYEKYKELIQRVLFKVANHGHLCRFSSKLVDAIRQRNVAELAVTAQGYLLVCCNLHVPQRMAALVSEVSLDAVERFLMDGLDPLSVQTLEAVLTRANDLHDEEALSRLLAGIHKELPHLFPQHALGRLGHVWMRNGFRTHYEVTRAICAAGFNVNAPFPDGTLPLGVAAEAGNQEYVAILLEHGASPMATDQSGAVVWTFAGDQLTVELLLAEHGAPFPTDAAARWVQDGPQQLKGLRQIHALGQRFTEQTRKELNETLAVVLSGFPEEERRDALGLLFEMGLRGDPAADGDYYALKSAVLFEETELFALLLEHGFNVHGYCSNGNTVLHKMPIDSACLPLAIKAGACITRRNCDGELPFHYNEFDWRRAGNFDEWITRCVNTLSAGGAAPDEVDAWARMSCRDRERACPALHDRFS